MRVLHKICKRHHRSTKTRKTPGYLSIAGKIILVKKPHMKLVSSSDCSICVIQDLPGFSWTFVPLYNTCIRSYLTQDIAWKTILKSTWSLSAPLTAYMLYKICQVLVEHLCLLKTILITLRHVPEAYQPFWRQHRQHQSLLSRVLRPACTACWLNDDG